MAKIQTLSDDVVQKIAAGEVVERPAAVIKELVENSLDASATRIIIEIENAGKTLMRVTDNGQGIEEEDLPQAITRHATSKIKNISDLERINTFGFRGEALAAISAVSQFKITSRISQADAATMLCVSGGEKAVLEKIAAQPGTSVEIKKLFFNTPARLKFLKSDTTELNHIVNIVTAMALANTQAGFQVYSTKKELMNLPAGQTLEERLLPLIGRDIVGQLSPISAESEDFSITGLVSRVEHDFGDRSNQFFFVNKRPIVSRSLSHAVYQAYQRVMAKNRYPAVFIFIEIDPGLIDVNVHPTKKEVRFVREKDVHDQLYLAIEKTLDAGKPQDFSQFTAPSFYSPASTAPAGASGAAGTAHPEYGKGINYQTIAAARPAILPAGMVREEISEQPYLRQLKKMYILSEEENGLVIYDQHACHERVVYERLLKRKEYLAAEKQLLAIPISLDLSPGQCRTLQQSQEIFKQLGLDLEEVGADSYALCSAPANIECSDLKTLIKDMLNEFEYTDFPADIHQKQEKIIASFACHAAIKANTELSREEMRQLLMDLKNTDTPAYCPHGRPTYIKISYEQMLKSFRRQS